MGKHAGKVRKYALKFSKLYWKLHNRLINYSATNSTNPYITTILLHTTYYCLLSIIDYYLSRRRKKNLAVKKIKALDHCFGKSLRQFLCEARSILPFPVQVTHFRFNHIRFNHFRVNHFRLITSGSRKTPQYQHTISLFFSF